MTYNDFINIYWIVGFLIPLIIFFIYLKHNLIFDEYLNHFKIGTLATKYYCTSMVDSWSHSPADVGGAGPAWLVFKATGVSGGTVSSLT